MHKSKLTKEQRRSLMLKRLSIFCFVLAAAWWLLLVFFQNPKVQEQLADINSWFYRLETYVAAFDKFSACSIIMFLFLFRAVIPVIPFSVLFVTSGLVFADAHSALSIVLNMAGIALHLSIKFLYGRRYGGGNGHKLVMKSESITKFMDFKGKGNKWMLSILCFLVIFPLGTVAQAYGATGMRYSRFMAFSLVGFLPRLILWSAIGVNITTPFTTGFFLPFIILCIFSGFSALFLDGLLKLIRKDDKNEIVGNENT